MYVCSAGMWGEGRLAAVRDLWARGAEGLPTGQGLARTFPSFGIHLSDAPPAVPPDPAIAVRGAVAAPFELPLTVLDELPRRTLVADFHCVGGWSFRDLTWEGVGFRALWEEAILPRAAPPAEITHLVFGGLDGFSSAFTIEDALAADVLVADRLDGAPLTGSHGAPARIVSPRQYGYMSTKHLARIELHTSEPPRARHTSRLRAFALSFVSPHPRARVEHEERHRYLPGWSVRFLYRRVVLPVLAARIGRR